MATADSTNVRATSGVPASAGAGSAATAASAANDQPFGPHAAAILASEHWSLLASRSLIGMRP
jgi:hypothetical protein